jgi:OOP family OmpA-OmpF porin
MRYSRLLAGLALPMLVAGCAGFPGSKVYLEELKGTTPTGTPFTQALSREYRAFADADEAQLDWINSWYFARKGLQAAKGTMVVPEQPADWSIREGQSASDLAAARSRLVAVLDTGAPARAPALTATAQVKYDCWVESQAYAWKHDDIAACRNDFVAAIDAIGKQAAPTPAAAAPAPAVTPTADRYQLFFEFNSSKLTPDANKVIADLVKEVRAAGYPRLMLVGYADLTGSSDYNIWLSLRRALAVKKALVAAGVPADKVSVEGRGKANPLVPTADRVREPQNRRVAVRFMD